jgi:hypothetical protein
MPMADPAPPEPEEELPPGTRACIQHPKRAAVVSCSICAEPFCAECVDQVGPAAMCASCAAAEGRAPYGGQPGSQPVETAMTKQAREALILSIVGFFCCGILLEPMALVKAIKVRRQAKISPVRIKGHEEATIAMVISIIALILWVVVTTARLWLIANK